MVAQLMRYKKSVPFSRRLNVWIENKIQELIEAGKIDGVDYTQDDGYDTFEAISKYHNQTNRLMVWTGASEGTVFAEPRVNWLFRAWHDYVHIAYNLPFTTEGESNAAFIQVAQLPCDWHLERSIILSEVIGQVLYNNYHEGQFPENQRAFVVHHMLTGDVTRKF